MNPFGAILILALLAMPAGSFADIYKCVSDDGVVKFGDRPCGEESKILVLSQSLDDVIALARPFRQSLPAPDRITNDLLAHAKQIGALICPGLAFSPYFPQVHAKDEHHSEWEVELKYVDDGLPAWQIKVNYRKKMQIHGYQLWLKSITVHRWSEPFSPPAMGQVTALKKTGPGEWVAP